MRNSVVRNVRQAFYYGSSHDGLDGIAKYCKNCINHIRSSTGYPHRRLTLYTQYNDHDNTDYTL